MTSIQKNNSRVVTHCRGEHGGRPSECARDRLPHRQRNICGATVREQTLYVRRSHMRSEPYHDELYTFRGVTKQRRHRRNGGSSCAMDERRCGHDMMSNNLVWGYFCKVTPSGCWTIEVTQAVVILDVTRLCCSTVLEWASIEIVK